MAKLFSKPGTSKEKTTRFIALLAYAVSATLNPPNYGFINKDEAAAMYKQEPTLITIDETVTNGDTVKVVATQAGIDAQKQIEAGNDATQATQADNAALGAEGGVTAAPAAPAAEKKTRKPPMVAQVRTLTEMPAQAPRGGGNGNEGYPFKGLAVFPQENNSFFLPVTDEYPDPLKAISSTVGSANKRYSQGEYASAPRKFESRKVYENGVYTGAVVIRTA